MRVLLTSHGSTGDIYPLIAYGRALKDHGHKVCYATAPLYREEIERAGLDFAPLPPSWGKEIFAEFMRELNRAPHPLLQLIHIYCGGLPFMGEVIDRMDALLENSDVMVSSYFFPHYRTLAEKKGVPFATFAFCHNIVPSDLHPPEGIPRLPGLPRVVSKHWNRFWWRLSNSIVDFVLNKICGALMREKGLPPISGFLTSPAKLELVTVSPQIMGQRWQPDPAFKFVGYLRWQSPTDPELEKELLAFRGDEKVPVLTFGSVTFDDTHTIMSRLLKHWPKHKKIIIQSGWAGLSLEVDRPTIKIVGKVSHDQLFAHASCVIHHGGAGTTASVLFSGKPQIIIPHIADQFFFGSEIKRLKCGLVLPKKRWPEKLSNRVELIESRTRFRAKAAIIADILRSEDGPGEAVRVLEEFVRNEKRCAHSDATHSKSG